MEYEIIRSDRRTLAAQIKEGRLIIRAPRRASSAEIRRFVEQNREWIDTHLKKAQERERQKEKVEKLTREETAALAKRAAEVIPERVRHYAPLVGVTYGRITIRRQKTRWGSCSKTGDLSFNCLLMLAPEEVVDSVVVHELCHRKEMNHSPRFYAEVLRVFPDYKKHSKWLRENGEMLLSRIEEP